MPQTRTQDLIVAGPLQNVSVLYKNKSYVASSIFPLLTLPSPYAKIARYVKGAWFRDEAKIVAPTAESPIAGYNVDFLDVAAKEYGIASFVTDDDRRFASVPGAPPLKPDQDAIEFATDKIDLSIEGRVASTILNGTWSGLSGGEDAAGLWAPNDGTNTFLEDVFYRMETIRGNTGITPNTLVLSRNTWNKLIQNDKIIDRLRYNAIGILTPQTLTSILGIERVVIGDAIKSTAVETKAGTDFTASNVWEKTATKGSAFLGYVPTSAGLKTPSAGYIARVPYEGGMVRKITTWRDSAKHLDMYEVLEMTDVVQTGADLGFLWVDTILT